VLLFCNKDISDKYLAWHFVVFPAFFIGCALNYAADTQGAGAQGISATFLNKTELMEGDSWHSSPLDINRAGKNILKYDAIWCAELITKYNRNAWRYIRQKHPKKLMLYYISGNTAQVKGGLTFLDYDYIRKYHPEWFLLADTHAAGTESYRDPKKRIRWNSTNPKHSYYNRFFIDVCNKDFQKWAAKELLERVSGRYEHLEYGYDGIGMDNVGLGALERYLTKRYPHWKYAADAKRWNSGYFAYLRAIHDVLSANGYILVVNHTLDYGSNRDGDNWSTLMKIADGMMDENALGPPGQPLWGEEKWRFSIQHHEETLRKGLYDWWICNPVDNLKKGYQQFIYVYCSFLLVKQPGRSFFSAGRIKGISRNSTGCWYDEYNLPIGKPRGERYRQQNCWLRDYEDAKIVVNPGPVSQRISLGADKYWLHWGAQKKITVLELPAHSAAILLPSVYKVEQQK